MKVMKIRHHFSFLISHFSFLIIFLLSCQTAPKTPDISLDGGLPLEPGAYAYVIAEKDAMPLLSQIMFNDINNKQFQQMVDRTRFAAAAVYVTPDGKTGKSASRYRLAAWGSYPASRAKMGFSSGKEWQKRRSAVLGADYWYSSQRGLSVAVTAVTAFVASAAASDQNPPDPYAAAPGVALPEGFAAFREGSILSCWLTDPGAGINQRLGSMGIPFEIPAQQLFLSLLPANDQRYTARLQIHLTNENQARALAAMFALARNFIPAQTNANTAAALLPSLLFANPPEQDGSSITVTGAPLSAREIALLLTMFSL